VPQIIGILIALYLLYLLIVYVVIPAIGVLAAVAAVFAAVGAVYGVGLSCYNFVCACRDNLFKRAVVQESARESYFYWQGDWYFNLIDTCKATWEANAQQAQSFETQRERWWRENWGTFPAFFCAAVIIAVWVGTIIFLPILFVIFGSFFSLVFATYSLLAYSLYYVESVYLQIHGVFTLCPTCGHKVPRTDIVFLCPAAPACTAEHQHLMPTPRYGIFWRTCKCGQKIPTTRFTGRNELKARCPYPDCGVSLSSEEYRPMTIAFLGGPSVGKSMVHLAICCDAERVFQQHGWSYSTNPDDTKEIVKLKDYMRRGIMVDSTQDTGQVKALCIDLQKPESTFPQRLYFYDPPGELFSESDKMADYNYYKYLRAVVIVIDPFALPQVMQVFANTLKDNARRQEIKPSSVTPDESFAHWLISMERDHGGMAKKTLCAVLINKTDVPGFAEITGLSTGASDEACRDFLIRYRLENFIRQIEENFRECRFYAISTTGGSPSGTPFQPKGIEQAMDWLFTHDCFE